MFMICLRILTLNLFSFSFLPFLYTTHQNSLACLAHSSNFDDGVKSKLIDFSPIFVLNCNVLLWADQWRSRRLGPREDSRVCKLTSEGTTVDRSGFTLVIFVWSGAYILCYWSRHWVYFHPKIYYIRIGYTVFL